VLFGEYAHLQCYNRRELVTDPGLRDVWALGVDEMWRRMYASEGVLGGAVWAGIDDVFAVPENPLDLPGTQHHGVGYGEWGLIDYVRYNRPEAWHLKQIYSPVRIAAEPLPMPAPGAPVRIACDNRHDFTDLAELRFAWRMGVQSGTATASGAPRGPGTIELQSLPDVLAGRVLELTCTSPRAFEVNRWRLSFGAKPPAPLPGLTAGATLVEQPEAYTVHSGNTAFRFDRATGELTATAGGATLLAGGPTLMLLPLSGEGFSQLRGDEPIPAAFNDACSGWQAKKVAAGKAGERVEVRVTGSYDQAEGEVILTIGGAGELQVRYDFSLKHPLVPRQVGVLLDVPRDLSKLSWRRHGQWTAYPEDHIGRTEGESDARGRIAISAIHGPPMANVPSRLWDTLGSDDFRATRHFIREVALGGPAGAVRALSDGRQHARAWIDGDRIRLLIADLSNEGCPACFNEYVMPRPSLKPGDRVRGTVRLRIESTASTPAGR
jgi:hypothetical protein